MESILPYCSSIISNEYNVYSALFIAGLISGFVHCSSMCGPFVVMQANANMASDTNKNISEFSRLRSSALLPYHLGRSLTYVILASIAAYLSSHILVHPEMKWFAAIMLLVSGIIFINYAFSRNKKGFLGLKFVIPKLLENKIKPLFKTPKGLNGFALGAVLGLIPCGMIISAIFAVSATGDVIKAAIAMSLFGLGTIPGLFTVSYGSNIFLSRLKSKKFKEGFQNFIVFIGGAILIETAIKIIFVQ